MELELEKYTYEWVEAKTINEFISLLVEGHARSHLPEELEKYFVEMMRDGWFLKWPLIRCKYAEMLLYGYCLGYDWIDYDKEMAIELLLPLAEGGLAPAQYDIWGYNYRYNTLEEGVTWLIKSSKQNYPPAQEELKRFRDEADFEKLTIGAQKEVLSEIERINLQN